MVLGIDTRKMARGMIREGRVRGFEDSFRVSGMFFPEWNRDFTEIVVKCEYLASNAKISSSEFKSMQSFLLTHRRISNFSFL